MECLIISGFPSSRIGRVRSPFRVVDVVEVLRVAFARAVPLGTDFIVPSTRSEVDW